MNANEAAKQQARELYELSERAARRQTKLFSTTGGKLALNPGAIEGVLSQRNGGTGRERYIQGHFILDEGGAALPQQPNLNFVGTGVIVTDSAATSATVVTIAGNHVIQDEGVPLAARTNLNIVGPGLTASDDALNDRTTITLPTASTTVEGTLSPSDKAKLDLLAPNHAVRHETAAGGDYLDPALYAIPAGTAHVADALAPLLDRAFQRLGGLETNSTGWGLTGWGLDGWGGTSGMGVADEGTALPYRPTLNFTGVGVVATDDATNSRINVAVSSGGGHTIQDEGVALTARTNLNFVGTGVTATDDATADSTVVTIPGGSGGYTTVQDEGVALTARGTLNVVGPALTATDDSAGNRTVIALPTATATVEGSFAPADKAKLDGIAAGAQVNVLEGVDATAPVTVSALAAKRQTVGIVAATTAAPGSMSAADKTKLDAYPTPSGLVLDTLLTNGGLEVWQRGGGAFTATGAYTADRWQLQLGTSGTASVAQDATNYDVGSGSCASVAYTHGTAVSVLIQSLEDYAQLRGRTLALSARVRGTVANGARVRLSDGTTSWYSGYHSGGGAYETLSVVAAIPAGATSVTVALELSVSGTYYLDNVMLVPGNQPQDYVPLTPVEDLARCQRYYETLGAPGWGDLLISGYQVTSGVVYETLAYKQPKTLTPTVTMVGVWTLSNTTTQPALSNISILGCWAYITVSSGGMAFAQNDTTGSCIAVEFNP